MKSSHSIPGKITVFLLVLAACACDDSSGGPEIQSMTLEIENEAGEVDRSCIALPVLIGSVSGQSIEVSGDFTVTTLATNREVELKYTGTTPFEKSYALEDIAYQEWPLVADSRDETYLVTLSLGCSGPTPAP